MTEPRHTITPVLIDPVAGDEAEFIIRYTDGTAYTRLQVHNAIQHYATLVNEGDPLKEANDYIQELEKDNTALHARIKELETGLRIRRMQKQHT